MIKNPEITWRRLTVKAEDIPLYRDGKTVTLRPVKESGLSSLSKQKALDSVVDLLHKDGSPWGWAMSDRSNRVYSCETLVRDTQVMWARYEDGELAHREWGWENHRGQWKPWKRSRHPAIFQPKDLARFTAALADIEVAYIQELHPSTYRFMMRDPQTYPKRWNQMHKKYKFEFNPLVWILTLDDFEWREQ